jgi:hypothetical protein
LTSKSKLRRRGRRARSRVRCRRRSDLDEAIGRLLDGQAEEGDRAETMLAQLDQIIEHTREIEAIVLEDKKRQGF